MALNEILEYIDGTEKSKKNMRQHKISNFFYVVAYRLVWLGNFQIETDPSEVFPTLGGLGVVKISPLG